jgi:formate hydrogenlyase subunit 4
MSDFFSQPWLIPLVVGACILLLAPLAVAFTVLLERKILADMQARLGPMRVGPHGLLQTIADAVKLLMKEDVVPAEANRIMFRLAPVVTFFTAATTLTVIPFSARFQVTDTNVALLVITAMSSVGILGIILGGWSSNSHYSLLGGLRSGAQLISYEVALGLSLVCGVMMANTLSMQGIVRAQLERGVWFAFDNYGLMLIPTMVFLIASVAETNRAPFDLPEAESELVARLPHRVQRLPLGRLHAVGIHQHVRHRQRAGDAVFRRLAAPVPQRRPAGDPVQLRRPAGCVRRVRAAVLLPDAQAADARLRAGAGRRRGRALGARAAVPLPGLQPRGRARVLVDDQAGGGCSTSSSGCAARSRATATTS